MKDRQTKSVETSEQNGNHRTAGGAKRIVIIVLAVIAAFAAIYLVFTEVMRKPSEPPIDDSTSATAEPTTLQESTSATPAQTKPDESGAVDYSGGWSQQWLCSYETDDETLKMLMAVDSTEHGTAGASLKEIRSAVCVLKLSADPTECLEKVREYVARMNATQADYFSCQWQTAADTALSALESPGSYEGLLTDVGEEDVILSSFNADAVNELNEAVIEILHAAGVRDEWKNHTEILY